MYTSCSTDHILLQQTWMEVAWIATFQMLSEAQRLNENDDGHQEEADDRRHDNDDGNINLEGPKLGNGEILRQLMIRKLWNLLTRWSTLSLGACHISFTKLSIFIQTWIKNNTKTTRRSSSSSNSTTATTTTVQEESIVPQLWFLCRQRAMSESAGLVVPSINTRRSLDPHKLGNKTCPGTSSRCPECLNWGTKRGKSAKISKKAYCCQIHKTSVGLGLLGPGQEIWCGFTSPKKGKRNGRTDKRGFWSPFRLIWLNSCVLWALRLWFQDLLSGLHVSQNWKKRAWGTMNCILIKLS